MASSSWVVFEVEWTTLTSIYTGKPSEGVRSLEGINSKYLGIKDEKKKYFPDSFSL